MNRSQPYVRMINPPKQRRTAEQQKTPLSKVEVAAVLGIIAVCAFVASRFYVEGVSQSLGYDLNSYLNIQDYVQLSSSWMLSATWLIAIVHIVSLLLSPQIEKYQLKMLRRIGFRVKIYFIITKWFRHLTPVLVLLIWCSYAFFAGLSFIRDAAVTSIQLSDNRIFEGRVVLAVSRYIILLRDGNILTILPQTGISRIMVHLPSKDKSYRFPLYPPE